MRTSILLVVFLLSSIALFNFSIKSTSDKAISASDVYNYLQENQEFADEGISRYQQSKSYISDYNLTPSQAITYTDAAVLINEYLDFMDTLGVDLDTITKSVLFRPEAFTSLQSLSGYDGIRIYFAKYPEGSGQNASQTLILRAVDNTGMDIDYSSGINPAENYGTGCPQFCPNGSKGYFNETNSPGNSRPK